MRGLPAHLVGALPLLLLVACAGGGEGDSAGGLPSAHSSPPPIVLVTVEGLRADAVGGLLPRPPRQSFTPNLDQLVTEADWAGRAIAPSTVTLPALASLLTGLSPWQHQVLQPTDALDRTTPTLAEVLQEAGYSTAAYVTGPWPDSGAGFARGFEDFRGLRGGGRAKGDLAGLGGEPRFLWLHFHEPAPPYRLPEALASEGRDRITAEELEAYRDPAVDLPASLRREVWRAYLQHVLLVDFQIGGMLEALRQSPAWPQVLLFVASVHGEEFGEQGQIGHGENLSRMALEVPLIVKLPKGEEVGSAGTLEGLGHPSIHRVWATAVELAGLRPPPAVEPSLLEGGRGGALAELYRSDGARLFSLVDGDLQLVRKAAPREGVDAKECPPFSGPPSRAEMGTTLWSWQGRVARPLHDPAAGDRLEHQLRRRWSFFLDRERSLAEEKRLREGP